MALTRPRAYQIYDLDYKQATRVVTTTNITVAGGAPNSVDGVTLSLNDRILVTGQTSGSQNGVYYVTTLGTGSNGTWARSTDTNNTGELLSGTIIMVTEGVIYADTQWKLITDDPIVIGSSTLTFVQNYSANSISSGNSNVTVLSNSSVLISSAGTANVAKFDSTNVTFTANLLPSSNVTYSLGTTTQRWSNLWLSNSTIYLGNVNLSASSTTLTVNGANVLTGNAGAIFSTSGNIVGGNILTAGYVSATGNVTGNYIIGNGSQLTGLPASYSNTNVSSFLAAFGSNTISTTGTVTAGNITGGNLLTGGLISATGNITGGNIMGGANVNATTHTGTTVSVSANITGGNILTGGQISATGTITSNGVTNGTAFAVGNSAVSNVALGMFPTAGQSGEYAIRDYSNVATNMYFDVGMGGTANGAFQFRTSNSFRQLANINSIGVTTPLAVSATGNITGNYFIGNGSQLTGITASGGASITNGTSNVVVAASGNVTVGVAGTAAAATFTTVGIIANSVATTNNGNAFNFKVGDDAWLGDINTADTIGIRGQQNAANAYIVFGNADATALGRAGSGPLTYAGAFSASGNVTGGNILTAGLISATSTITGSTLLAGGISLTGNSITSTNSTITIDPNSAGGVDGAVVIAGNLSVQGNVTYIDSNVITTNEKSITLANNQNTGTALDGAGIDVGNNTLAYWRFNNATTSWQSNIAITPAANATLNLGGTSNYWSTVYAATYTGTTVTAAANVTGGNILTAGLISATGSITSAGNLSLTGNIIDIGELWINTSANGNINLNPNGTGTTNIPVGVLSVTGNIQAGNLRTAGLISAAANITGGNILTAGLISATSTITSAANITGGNILTAGLISATSTITSAANITGGNILTAGIMSSTGNGIHGNILTGGLISSTGNITSGNVLSNGRLSVVGNIVQSAANSYVAWSETVAATAAGTVQANAYAINTTSVQFTTVASGAGAILPAAATVGQLAFVANDSANALLLYPPTGGVIDQATANTAVTVSGLGMWMGIALTSTNWTTISPDTAGTTNQITVTQGNGIVTLALASSPSVSGNITGGNILTAGLISATGNIQGGNLRTAGLISATGNIQGGNLRTAGLISATGGLTAGTLNASGNAAVASLLNITDTAPQGATKTINITSGTNGFAIVGNITNGSYNSLQSTGDIALLATGNTIGNVGLSIIPWASATSGIKMNTVSNVTTITLAATTISLTGNILNGQANGVGNIGNATGYFNTIFAKATSAQYADLAEMYVADADYSAGTVVEFGGKCEITVSKESHTARVAGVISTNPSYLMNSAQQGTHVLPIALTGRVPCRVVGTIYKGDRLVASGVYPGVATGLDKEFYEPGCIIGKALEDYSSTEVGIIEVAVGRF